MRRTESSCQGFTLMEMIVAMVVLGIVASMVTVFISAPVRGYRDSVERARLADTADTLLRRMVRDIRLAVPNSVRVSPDGQVLELLLTRTGGRYLSAGDGAAASTPVLDFDNSSATSFTLIGDFPTGKHAILPGDLVVVNNLGTGFAPADAYSGGNSAVVIGVDSATQVISLATNPFAQQDPELPSPSARFQVVSGPVLYQCSPVPGGTGTISRSSGYTINAALTAPVSGGVTSLAATQVAACAFRLVALGGTRSALVILSVTLQAPGSPDGPMQLTHQVHVDNTP